jgi:excisionase family DNA binding protein
MQGTALYCSLTSNMPADPNPIPIPKLLTPDELAHALRISKVGVYRLVEKRTIPFYKVRGSLRFDQKDVIEFLQRNRIGSAGHI